VFVYLILRYIADSLIFLVKQSSIVVFLRIFFKVVSWAKLSLESRDSR